MSSFKAYLIESILLKEELTDKEKETVHKWAADHMKVGSYDFTHHIFGSNTNARIEIPIEDIAEKENTVQPDTEVVQHLAKHGYSVKDYKSGIASRKVIIQHPQLGVMEKEVEEKIGKALEKTKAPESIKQKFMNASSRALKTGNDDYKIVISRHPYDVAGMSTDRGWTSCMNMEDGCNVSYLKHDIGEGTHVAYLVKKNDDNIDAPVARIALKPYVSSSGEKILRPGKIYGTAAAKFFLTVKQWCMDKFKMKEGEAYKMPSTLYADAQETTLVNYNKETIDTILSSNDKNKKRTVMSSDVVTPEQISKALDDKDPILRDLAIQHSNATAEHISKALGDKDPGFRKKALRNPNATAEHISKALDDKDPKVRVAAIRNLNATAEHISKALDDVATGVRWGAAEHPNATPEHISKALKDEYAIIRRKAVGNPNATPEHISKALKDKDAVVRWHTLQHPNITADQISGVMNDTDKDVRMIANRLHRDITKNNLIHLGFGNWGYRDSAGVAHTTHRKVNDSFVRV